MKRALLIAGATLGALLLGGSTVLFWASSGSLPDGQLAQLKSYPASPASPDRDTFTVMTYNLDHLSGGSENASSVDSDRRVQRNVEAAVDLIRQVNPEFVGLQDVDFGSAHSGGIQQLDTLATRLDYASGAQAVSWNERYLPSALAPDATRSGSVVSGQGLLSRFLLRRHAREELPSGSGYVLDNPFSPSPLAQVAMADVGGWPVVLINVDLDASDVDTREQQAESVNALYKRLARFGFPILLFGNINSVWPSAVSSLPSDFQSQFSEDETMELLVEGTSLKPAFSEGAYLTGTSVNTYPASDPTLKLDYIFYRPRQIVPTDSDIHCGSPPRFPSNHCAVTMTFLLPRPKAQLPDHRIPDEKLPSMDRLMSGNVNR